MCSKFISIVKNKIMLILCKTDIGVVKTPVATTSSSTSEVNSSSGGSNGDDCVFAKIHLLSDMLAKQTRELKASVRQVDRRRAETSATSDVVSPQMISTCRQLRREMVALLRTQTSGMRQRYGVDHVDKSSTPYLLQNENWRTARESVQIDSIWW